MKIMKKKYQSNLLKNLSCRRTLLIFALACAGSFSMNSQTIAYAFANAQNTNDGMDDYYEADIVLTTNTDFKLGAGQFYLDYNTAAFGTSIHGGNLTFTHPVGAVTNYVLDEQIFGGALNGYSIVNANSTTSKLSISWSTAIAGQVSTNITSAGSPNLICHIKIKYVDVNESPNISFDVTTSPDAVTSFGLTFTDGGTQLTDDSYDSSGAVLPATSTTWDGSEDSDWTNSDNWSDGVPTPGLDVVIANAGIAPIVSTAVTIKSLTVDASASLTATGSSAGVTTTGDLINNGTLTFNSASSLIVQGSSTGNITYNRTLETDNWYLISSPVLGQDIDDFVTAEGLAQNLPNIALGSYNTSDDSWTYYQNLASGTGSFPQASGRSIKLTTAGDISFTGTINVTDAPVELTLAGNRFNLIGNPYPSYIAVNDLADGTNNLFRANGTNGVAGNDGNIVLEEDTIWFWDQSLNGGLGAYTQINLVNSKFIPPGQGFIVKRASGAGTFNFDFRENMQSHQATDEFSRIANTRPEIKLNMSSNSNSSFTEVYFLDGTTLGFDNGYDSTIFSGAANNFTVYTHLVNDSQGQDLGIQSVPDQDHENIVFPVGVNAVSGTEITFTTESINIPNGLSVILEDRLIGTYTVLDQSSDQYTVLLNQDNNGIGRFYIHINTMSVLSTDGFTSQNVSMYTTSIRNLRITGLEKGKTSLKMFSILGKQVMHTSFDGDMVNDIELPSKLRTGIYILKLVTAKGSLKKKIILNKIK